MTKLTTPTGLFIAGRWLQPGDAVPDRVPGYDYAKAARKGLIEHQGGEEITNPTPEAAAGEDAERASDLEQINYDLKASLDKTSEDLATVGAERDALKEKITELADALQRAQTTRDELHQDLTATRAALEHLQNAPAPSLPADARDRLIALNGINEKRADEILAALTRAD